MDFLSQENSELGRGGSVFVCFLFNVLMNSRPINLNIFLGYLLYMEIIKRKHSNPQRPQCLCYLESNLNSVNWKTEWAWTIYLKKKSKPLKSAALKGGKGITSKMLLDGICYHLAERFLNNSFYLFVYLFPWKVLFLINCHFWKERKKKGNF